MAYFTEEDLRTQLQAECAKYGLNKWCKRHPGTHSGNVSHVLSGERPVSPVTARALGFERVYVYRRIDHATD